MKERHVAAPLALLSGLLFSPILFAQTGTIVTIAGTGMYGTAGVGGPAVNAELSSPGGIAIDSADNLYIADGSNNRVVRVDAATGILTLVAGNGAAVYGGDGGPAAQASIYEPGGLALDAAGNLFIVEFPSHRIRRVDSQTGIITTFAGNGTAAFSGDGGPAANASLKYPTDLAFDSAGNLFIADSGNARIRRVDAQSGIITTVAGNGTYAVTPDGVSATTASFSPPLGLSIDGSGNLFISESTKIRRVDAVTGILTTFAGTGSGYNGDGIPATSAGLGQYGAGTAKIDSSGNFFFADSTGRIRRVDGSSGLITTVAGNGSGAQGEIAVGGNGGGGSYPCPPAVGDNGPASIATLDGPGGVVLTRNGNLILTDWIDCRVRRVYLPSPYPYTNTTVTGSATTAPAGQMVLYYATVSPIGAGGVPTGTVTFADALPFSSATVLGSAPLNGGSAFLAVSSLTLVGNHNIVAYYGGDSSFNGSGSPGVPLTITAAQQRAVPTVTLVSNQNPTTLNAPTSFTATVTPPPGSTASPTGSVMLIGNTLLQTVSLVNGTAQFSASFKMAGPQTVGVLYGGDNNYSQVASASVMETVNAAATTTTLTSNMSPSTYGQSLLLTAAVSPSSATGSVQFLDGGVALGSAPVSGGTAVLPISSLAAGSHTLTAVYGGDSSDAGSTSAALAQTVVKRRHRLLSVPM